VGLFDPQPLEVTSGEGGDFALHFADALADLVVHDDDVLGDTGLRTAVLLSLFVDQRAQDDDELPGAEDDVRGWWADEFADVEGDRIGSRLWLLERSTLSAATAPRAAELAREALQWLIDDRVAAKVDVVAEAGRGVLVLAPTIHRPGRDPVTFRFAHAWDGEATRTEAT
jgi:phage gp46-like protein